MENPNDDNQLQEAATGRGLSRQPTTTHDSEFTLSIEEAATLYERAGHPRTPRSIQRYCGKGHLEYRRMETSFGEKFLISPTSVMKHIAYIEEVRPVATGRGMPGQGATDVAPKIARDSETPEPHMTATTSADEPGPAATEDRYVAALERENEFLRDQIGVKDTQISELQERAHETNALINGLQRLLSPLLAAPERKSTARDFDGDTH